VTGGSICRKISLFQNGIVKHGTADILGGDAKTEK